VQALFFADGGVLALGANIFNLGFFPAFVAYPLVYKTIVGGNPSRRRAVTGAVAAAVVGLQLGSLGVVLQTVFSGVSELPLGPFLALMQPIHLAIGVVEGLVTASVVLFVLRAQPDLLASSSRQSASAGPGVKRVAMGLAVAAVVVAVSAVGFASTRPDGLEWSIAKLAGTTEIDGASGVLHDRSAALQEKTALLPGYRFRNVARAESPGAEVPPPSQGAGPGVLGAGISVALIVLAGLGLKRRSSDRP
jgi:cobalt/nickel transport system permease protein